MVNLTLGYVKAPGVPSRIGVGFDWPFAMGTRWSQERSQSQQPSENRDDVYCLQWLAILFTTSGHSVYNVRMAESGKSAAIQKFIVENVEQHPGDIASAAVAHFGISRQLAHRHLRRLVEKGSLYRSIRKLRGKLRWDGDVASSRRSRVTPHDADR